ncbi:MAG: HTH domain-containing protein, partial [Clostridia bacterium]|nr:HTH domain-containing protein [Clostridia bacterium]
IGGSIIDTDFIEDYLGMRVESVDEVEVIRRMTEEIYDKEEFESDFGRFYYFGGLKYDTSLSEIYGPIDFSGLIELRKKEVFIPHKFFKAFDKLSGQAIRLYLAIKMLEHTDEKATLEKLAELLSISVRALRTTMQELQGSGMIYVTEGIRKLGIPNTYHTDRFNSAVAGYMALSYNDIKSYVTELYEPGSRGNGELKVYLHLRWKFYSGNIFVSQATLGETLGLAQNTVSVIVNRLQDRHFLKIEKVHYGPMESCRYKLLR